MEEKNGKKDFYLEFEKKAETDIKVIGAVNMGEGHFQKSRMFISPVSIKDVMVKLKEKNLAEKDGSLGVVVDNDRDRIEFIIEKVAGVTMLSITADHTFEDGKKDGYGILDIPLVIEDKVMEDYPLMLAGELEKYC